MEQVAAQNCCATPAALPLLFHVTAGCAPAAAPLQPPRASPPAVAGSWAVWDHADHTVCRPALAPRPQVRAGCPPASAACPVGLCTMHLMPAPSSPLLLLLQAQGSPSTRSEGGRPCNPPTPCPAASPACSGLCVSWAVAGRLAGAPPRPPAPRAGGFLRAAAARSHRPLIVARSAGSGGGVLDRPAPGQDQRCAAAAATRRPALRRPRRARRAAAESPLAPGFCAGERRGGGGPPATGCCCTTTTSTAESMWCRC